MNGQIPQYKLVWDYYNQQCAKNAPVSWKEFSQIYHGVTKDRYYEGKISWRDEYLGDSVAMRWYNTIGPGKISGTEQVYQYIDEKYEHDESAAWVDFHRLFPAYSGDIFCRGKEKWQKKHTEDLKAMQWFRELGPGGESAAETTRKFFDERHATNASASWEDFTTLYPSISQYGFEWGAKTWYKTNENDPKACYWYENIRLGKNLKQQIWRYLDWQLAANAPATWKDIHWRNPDIRLNTYNHAHSVWRTSNIGNSRAIYWYDYVRPGRISANIKVGRYLDWQCAGNTQASWREFQRLEPLIDFRLFCNGQQKWRMTHKDDPDAISWYTILRKGETKITPTEQGRRFLDWQWAANKPANWREFKQVYSKTIPRDIFERSTRSWRKNHADDPDAMRWFNEIRPGVPVVEIIRRYCDWQYAGGEPATWGDFHNRCETVPRKRFTRGKEAWRESHKEDPSAMRWYDAHNLQATNAQQARRYIDWQCAAGAPASWADCRLRAPRLNFHSFHNSRDRWRVQHAADAPAMQWYDEVRIAPNLQNHVGEWLNRQCATNGSGWFWDFTQGHLNIKRDVFYTGKRLWKEHHARDPHVQEWISKYTREFQNASRVGKYLEKCVIADLYGALHAKGILLYHETKDLAELGRLQDIAGRSGKRVEVRLFAEDLLTRDHEIGPALREFLVRSKRPQLGIDITIGRGIGRKITLYADQMTGLLVVTLQDAGGQRQLEPHVQVLSIRELAGSQWFNLDEATRHSLDRAVKECFDALRSDPGSAELDRLEVSARSKWQGVVDDLKTRGSQAEYQARVADDVANHLRHGKMPKELTAYTESARAAGHVEHADRIEGLAQAVAALARDKGSAADKKSTPPAPKPAALDPARLAEAREFARAIQAARDADAAREKEKQGIDPARLAEAREFARAIQAARDADKARADAGPDSDAGAERAI